MRGVGLVGGQYASQRTIMYLVETQSQTALRPARAGPAASVGRHPVPSDAVCLCHSIPSMRVWVLVRLIPPVRLRGCGLGYWGYPPYPQGQDTSAPARIV